MSRAAPAPAGRRPEILPKSPPPKVCGRGLAALQALLQVHDKGATACFASEGNSAVLGYEVPTPGMPGADQVTFGALAIAANVLRSLCGTGFRFRAADFAYRAPPDVSLFRRFFGALVRFDAERSPLAFEARRLNEHGTSFNKLLDEARFLAARNLLQSSQAPVAEIATRLGYSDTAAFTRAFRRWAGTSPTEWRHRNGRIWRRQSA
jgi:hypothetical protein